MLYLGMMMLLHHFRLIAKIIQVGFYAGSIVFLFITTFVVLAGWGSSCLYSNITKYPNLDCTGPRYVLGHGPYPPNSADFITAAVSH